MKTMVAAVLAALSVSGVAAAGDKAEVNTPKATRVLYVCDTSLATRQAFARQYGAVRFVTAEEARAAEAAWSGPACITPAEHAKLKAGAAMRVASAAN